MKDCYHLKVFLHSRYVDTILVKVILETRITIVILFHSPADRSFWKCANCLHSFMWRHRRCSATGWEEIRDLYAIPVKSCCPRPLPSRSRFYSRRSTGPIAIYKTFSTCLFGPFSLFIRYDILVRNIWSSGVFIKPTVLSAFVYRSRVTQFYPLRKSLTSGTLSWKQQNWSNSLAWKVFGINRFVWEVRQSWFLHFQLSDSYWEGSVSVFVFFGRDHSGVVKNRGLQGTLSKKWHAVTFGTQGLESHWEFYLNICAFLFSVPRDTAE